MMNYPMTEMFNLSVGQLRYNNDCHSSQPLAGKGEITDLSGALEWRVLE